MRNMSSRRRRMSGGADESLAQGKNFAANMPGQMRQMGQMGGGNVYHGAPVLAGDAMLLDGDLRGKALMGPLDASTAAVRGMQDGGRRRRGRNNAPMRRNRNRSSRRGRGSRRNNGSARRGSRRNNASARRSRRGRNNASARRSRSRRGRNNASARRSRSRRGSRRNNNMYGGDGEEEYLPEVYENAVTPLQRRRNNMYGGSHSLLPTEYASVNQSPALISGAAAAKAGTAFTSDPFANGSGSA
jgi:hypothetical protein